LDFCKVLGVLLDNAIESAAESRKKYIELYAHELQGEDGITIEVINSYTGDIDKNRIFEDGFTTKENHTGFGLWEVRKIVEKYKDKFRLDTIVDDALFTQKLTVYYSK
jgi:two-component system sensor histidine kinase AgrC